MSALPAETGKCDGTLPCERCASRGEACKYQDRVWRTKDDLRGEIAKLQVGVTRVVDILERVASEVNPDMIEQFRQAANVDSIIGLLGMDMSAQDSGVDTNGTNFTASSSGELPAPPTSSGPSSWTRRGSPPDWAPSMTNGSPNGSPSAANADFASRIHASSFASGARHADAVSPLTNLPLPPMAQSLPANYPNVSPLSTVPPVWQPAAGRISVPLPLEQLPLDRRVIDTHWHSLTMGMDEIYETINVYMEWEHPGYSAIHKDAFYKDLASRRRRYCCEALVNAILARSYQMQECGGKTVERRHIKELTDQAKTLLTIERASLETEYPYIQTLTILASIEIVYGRLDSAKDYAFEAARLAILDALEKQGNPPVDEEHLIVRANTFCGAISLPRLLRLVTLQLDPMEAPEFMRLRRTGETPEGRIERGILLQRHFWSLLRWCPDQNQFSWEVTELTHTFMLFHFDENSTRQNKADLFEIYPKLQECWDRLDARRKSKDLTPGKIYNCLQYHFSIITVFKPYMDESALASTVSPRAVLANSAYTILQLAWHFKMHWGVGLVHLGFPYIVGLATETLVSLNKPSALSLDMGAETQPTDNAWASSETTCKGIMVLAELAPYHASAQGFLAVVSTRFQQQPRPPS